MKRIMYKTEKGIAIIIPTERFYDEIKASIIMNETFKVIKQDFENIGIIMPKDFNIENIEILFLCGEDKYSDIKKISTEKFGVNIPEETEYETTFKIIDEAESKITMTVDELEDVFYSIIIRKDIPRIINGILCGWNPQEMTYEDYLKLPLPEYKIVDESEILKDRTFRGAWNYDLKEDVPKAKEIWKTRLRIAREAKYIENDIVLRDAIIENDDIKMSKGLAERDRLRDVISLVDVCETIDEIKTVVI